MKDWKKIIDNICRAEGISKAKFAERLGKKRQYIDRLYNGQIVTPSETFVEQIEQAFNINISNSGLIRMHNLNEKYVRLTDCYYDLSEDIAMRYQGELGAIKVIGDSMYPTYKAGDVLIFCADRTDGEGVFAVSINKILTLKRIQTTPDGLISITSDNNRYKAMVYEYGKVPDFIEVVGKVVGKVEVY